MIDTSTQAELDGDLQLKRKVPVPLGAAEIAVSRIGSLWREKSQDVRYP